MESTVSTGRTTRRVPERTEAGRAPLICVSHREPFARRKVGGIEKLERTTGGLVTALDGALRELGGSWIASGPEDARTEAPEDAKGRTYRIEQLGLSQRTVDAYYGGFSNRVLWPLAHYFVGRVRFDADEWAEYHRVNLRFAETIARAAKAASHPQPIAWLHDYHLMLAPRFVRELAPAAAIGFFLHIPFPAWEVFRILPPRRELLEGLLGADLVGFHVPSYQAAFLECCRKGLGALVSGDTVLWQGRRVRTIASPIGIDLARQVELAERPKTVARAARLRQGAVGDRLVLGVDRLDYSKGIPERLLGFERLLERFPEHRKHVTLVQIAVPSRTRVEDYQRLKRHCDEEVGRINGRFGDGVWTPIRYVTHGFDAEELAAWYRAADVALVTPLRDGLNLVAKEYVASRVELGGALVLSEFAGSAEELTHAHFVNPFGADDIAEGLHRALTEDPQTARERMFELRREVMENDVADWARRFVEQIARAAA